MGSGNDLQLGLFEDSDRGPCVKLSLCIDSDFVWTLYVHGIALNSASPVMTSASPFLESVSQVASVLSFVDSCTICCGNPDEKYLPLVKSRKGKFVDVSG